MTLRGAWSRGAQAPSLFLINLPQAIYSGFSLRQAELHRRYLRDCVPTIVRLTTGGNPDLEPDEAETMSIGAVPRASGQSG